MFIYVVGLYVVGLYVVGLYDEQKECNIITNKERHRL